MNSILSEKIKEHLREKLSKNATAVSFALMYQGALESEGAIGSVDGSKEKPATPRNLYNVGSVSKVYCAAAVMILVQQGKVELDNTVCSYLPRFKMLDERYKLITVRMLLCHSSGLPGTHWKNSFASGWIENYYDDVYDYFAHSYLKADPGEFSVYCNDGFTLAEMIVAEVSKMSFSDFVRQYITKPLVADSTCYSDKLAGREHIEMPGRGIEYLTVMGTGGVNTDMYDCAKFAQIFIADNDILSETSRQEMMKPHGRTFIGTEEFPKNGFGLGWDTVGLDTAKYDFGPDVCSKGGGTIQFGSIMIAIPKYAVTAAASCTNDCGVDISALICEYVAMLLETKGIDVRRKKKELLKTSKIPTEHFEKYAGKYMNYSGITEISFSDSELLANIYTLEGERKPSAIPAMKYSDGVYAADNGMEISFAQARGRNSEENSIYLLQLLRTGRGHMPTHVKIKDSYGKAHPAWLERLSKKYIAYNTDPRDLVTFGVAGSIEFRTMDFAPGLMFLHAKSDKTMGPLWDMPFLPIEADIGTQFLDAPINGSRDTYAPLAYVRDGVEFIYCYGIEYIDAAEAEPLKTGTSAIGSEGNNIIYSFERACLPIVEVPQGGRFIALCEKAVPIYDSRTGGDFKHFDGGYLVLIGNTGDEFKVEINR